MRLDLADEGLGELLLLILNDLRVLHCAIKPAFIAYGVELAIEGVSTSFCGC